MIPAIDVNDFDLIYRGIPFHLNYKKILCIVPIEFTHEFLLIFSDFSTLAVNRYSYIPLGIAT